MSTLSNHRHANQHFNGIGFTEHQFSRFRSVSQNALKLGSTLCILFILTLSSDWYANGDEASSSIISAG